MGKWTAAMPDWSRLLAEVGKGICMCFERPDSEESKGFWLSACHVAGRDEIGDVKTLGGWITAFAYWNREGGGWCR